MKAWEAQRKAMEQKILEQQNNKAQAKDTGGAGAGAGAKPLPGGGGGGGAKKAEPDDDDDLDALLAELGTEPLCS